MVVELVEKEVGMAMVLAMVLVDLKSMRRIRVAWILESTEY